MTKNLLSDTLFFMRKQQERPQNIYSVDVHWADAGEMPVIREIRHTVFVEEQGVDPELERDGLDDQAAHCVLRENGSAVGCARIRRQTRDMKADQKIGLETERKTDKTREQPLFCWKIERLAVLPEARNRGYGKLIMEWIIRQARSEGIDGLTMHAQHQLIDFYAKLGFRTSGDYFLEAGIRHISMEMDFLT